MITFNITDRSHDDLQQVLAKALLASCRIFLAGKGGFEKFLHTKHFSENNVVVYN